VSRTPAVRARWGHRAAITVASWTINLGAVFLGMWARDAGSGTNPGVGPTLLWAAAWALAEVGLLSYLVLALRRGWVKENERGGIGTDLLLPPVVSVTIAFLKVMAGYAFR
jgi:ABC-type transport system involved in cytochrome c biogenesis permease component